MLSAVGKGMDNFIEDDSDPGPSSSPSSKLLWNRIRLLEQQVSACMESQPLLYQVFNKCNALEQKMKVMKKELDRCLLGHSEETDQDQDKDQDHQDEDQDCMSWQSRQGYFEESDRDFLDGELPLTGMDVEMETKPYECKFCGGGTSGTSKQLFDSAEGLANHYCTQHSQDIVDKHSQLTKQPRPRSRKASSTLVKHKCTQCGKRFMNKGIMQRHLDTIHSASAAKFSCNLCHFSFRRLDYLQRHKFNVHGTTRRGSSIKTTPTAAGSSLISTIATAHRDPSKETEDTSDTRLDPLSERTCPKCDGVFGNRYRMRRHLDTMHAAPSFPCDLCDKLFRRQDRVREHQMKVHGGLSDAVKASRKRRRRSKYKKLVDDKSKESPDDVLDSSKYVACTECGKSITKNNIYKHMIIHTGARPFTCDTCGARFRDGYDLRVHSTRHTGLKPYMCDKCDWGSEKASALVIHKMSHVQWDDVVEGVEVEADLANNLENPDPDQLSQDKDPAS